MKKDEKKLQMPALIIYKLVLVSTFKEKFIDSRAKGVIIVWDGHERI